MSWATRWRFLAVAITASFPGLLALTAPNASAATIRVTTFGDEYNDDADCSLREAVLAVNTSKSVSGCPGGDPFGPDVVVLETGGYTLDIPGSGGIASATGDLDVTSALTIRGAGMDRTSLNAALVEQAIQFHAPGTVKEIIVVGGSAAGIVSDAQEVYVDHVMVTGSGGDGIQNGHSIVVRDSRIQGNVGHGLETNPNDETTAITRSSFYDNGGAGIQSLEGDDLWIKHSSFYENGGAGLVFEEGNVLLENVTVVGNSGDGLLMESAAVLDVRHSTFASNQGHNANGYGALLVRNTIFADPSIHGSCSVVGVVQGDGNNIDEDGTCLDGAIEEDPMLRPLGMYGGPVPTSALKPGSPAIDESSEWCVATDARGVPRPQVNCNSSETNDQDLGAYELVRCAKGIVNQVGTPSRDVLEGSTGIDVFLALGGNDTILGDVGNDRACGGEGNDTLRGEAGNDKLLGESGDDKLSGGPGTDACIGGPGADSATACETKKSL